MVYSDAMRKMNSEQIIEYIKANFPTREQQLRDLHRWVIEANRIWKEKSAYLDWDEQVKLAREIDKLKKIIKSLRKELHKEGVQ